MNFRQFFTIYISTLQKELRSKMLLITFILTIVAIAVGGISYQGFATERPILFEFAKDFSLKFFFSLLLGWSNFLTTLFSVGCIRSDLQDRTMGQLLSFSIKRYEYLLARILGVVSIVFFYNCLVLFLGVVVFGPKEVPPLDIFLVLLVGIPVFASLTLWGVFFSLYFNQVISFVFVYIITFIVSGANVIVEESQLLSKSQDVDFWYIAGHIIYWCFPREPAWSVAASEALMGKGFGMDWGFEIGHYLLTTTLFFGMLTWLFGRREI